MTKTNIGISKISRYFMFDIDKGTIDHLVDNSLFAI